MFASGISGQRAFRNSLTHSLTIAAESEQPQTKCKRRGMSVACQPLDYVNLTESVLNIFHKEVLKYFMTLYLFLIHQLYSYGTINSSMKQYLILTTITIRISKGHITECFFIFKSFENIKLK